MILKPPHNLFLKEQAELDKDEKDLKILKQARKLRAMVDPSELELARILFKKAYRENTKSESQEEAMINSAIDIWLIARLLSDRFGTVLRPKLK